MDNTTRKVSWQCQSRVTEILYSNQIYLRREISLQKSCIFSVVRSCSSITLMATSVPLHMPRKTSPNDPTGNPQMIHNTQFMTYPAPHKRLMVKHWPHKLRDLSTRIKEASQKTDTKRLLKIIETKKSYQYLRESQFEAQKTQCSILQKASVADLAKMGTASWDPRTQLHLLCQIMSVLPRQVLGYSAKKVLIPDGWIQKKVQGWGQVCWNGGHPNHCLASPPHLPNEYLQTSLTPIKGGIQHQEQNTHYWVESALTLTATLVSPMTVVTALPLLWGSVQESKLSLCYKSHIQP